MLRNLSAKACKNWALINGAAALLGLGVFVVTRDGSTLATPVLNVIGMEFFHWLSRKGGI